jgi:undecaprenyl-diphosphatase
MSLLPASHAVVLAALEGFAEALPLSRSGHAAAAQIWIDPGSGAASRTLDLGVALALAVASRGRLATALGEGVRAIARPALFRSSPGARDAARVTLGVLVSLLVEHAVAPRVELWRASPSAAGIGLLVTGVALASTRFAPSTAALDDEDTASAGAAGEAPAAAAMVLVGAAHGLAVFPGASRVGAALVLLLWLGARPARAVDLALVLTIPSLFVAAREGAASATRAASALAPDLPALLLGTLFAFAATSLGAAALRALLGRRGLPALALWIVPLGLAMMAYGRALPYPS